MQHPRTISSRLITMRVLPLLLAGLLAGCSASQIGSEDNRFDPSQAVSDQITFPEEYKKEKAPFFVTNQIEIRASPEKIWRILTHADAWSSWYEGATNLKILDSQDGVLHTESVFTWRTMGLNFESRIREYSQPYRLSWESRKWCIQGYHGWLILPTSTGAKVITEEGFQGILGWLQGIFIPGKLPKLHEVWLQELKRKAEEE
jgi:Polyketide cyclase / dehydrase and lipid transport